MVVAVLLASLLAQAEPAPAEPPATPPIGAPAPPPATTPPPAPSPPPPALRNTLGLWGRFAYRVGKEGGSLGPASGFSIGGSFEYRYYRVDATPGFELAAGIDFFHDRFAKGVTGSSPDPTGAEQTYPATRAITETSFALIQAAALDLRVVRVFAAAGAGIAIAYLSTPELELRPGATSALQPLARATLGIELPLSRTMAAVARGDFTHTFNRPTFTPNGGQPYAFLGDLLAVGAGIKLRF